MRKQLVFLLTAIFMLMTLTIGVSAHEIPDLQADGSVTVTLHQPEEAARCGSLTVYQVAEIEEENGNFAYRLTEAFAPSGLVPAHPEDPELAKALAHYAALQEISGENVKIQNGTAVFAVPQGRLGLYLVTQQEPCEGYACISPFLIGVPSVEDGVYQYQVDASPKMGELIPVPTETEPQPEGPDEPTLPQTGQLNWPVPILAAAGLGLFLAGWILCRNGKEKKYDEV